MDEKHERKLRRQAVRLRLQGLGPSAILKRIPRSRSWLYKWSTRYEEVGWAGLRSQSRRPRRSPQQYSRRERQHVIWARRALEKRKVGLIGAAVVQEELRQRRVLRRIPSATTIKRILREARPVKRLPVAPPQVSYPWPTACDKYVLYAMDWTARYLHGGAKVFAFHSIDLETHVIHQTISTNKNGETVHRHVLETLQTLGFPHGLQMDNDAAFCGGYKVPRVFGQLVRLCLYLGIEPIFIPVAEPQRNGRVEFVNQLWSRSFWKRRRFRSVAHVQRACPEFDTWYSQHYKPPALNGQTPAQAALACQARRQRLRSQQRRVLPKHLPISAGRVHFIRRVSAQGQIDILNETWFVGKRLAQQYVWATIVTHERRLNIYHRRSSQTSARLVKASRYAIPETVAPVRSEFKRAGRRRKMSTML